MKLYVIATIQKVSYDDDVFADIILVTDDERRARTTKYQVKNMKPLPGLDYSMLAPYEDVIYFERELNEVIKNEGV